MGKPAFKLNRYKVLAHMVRQQLYGTMRHAQRVWMQLAFGAQHLSLS